MKQGSVIVDMAAEQGGNCELTVPGEVVVARRHHHRLQGPAEPPREAGVARSTRTTCSASPRTRARRKMTATHRIDMEDEVLRGTDGHQGGRDHLAAAAAEAARPRRRAKPAAAAGRRQERRTATARRAADVARRRPRPVRRRRALFLLIGRYAPPSFLGHFTVFVLACFVGYMVVWNVKPALHTPLMSVTNAVSSIIAIGALVQIAPDLTEIRPTCRGPTSGSAGCRWPRIALATINMFGGFAVTQRMLQMFRK